jgi:hypothetical protein
MARLRRRRHGGGLDAADLDARSRPRLPQAEAWGGVMLQRGHATSAIPTSLGRVEVEGGAGGRTVEEAARVRGGNLSVRPVGPEYCRPLHAPSGGCYC